MDIEGYGEFGGISEEDDDIARFERQCAERARAEGALPEEGSEDEDEQIKRKRLVTGGQPQDINEWQEKCELLHDKLGRKEGELAQVKADLEMLRNDGLGPEDSQTALKQRLLDLTKKNRRLQVTVDGQRVRLQQLEIEVKKPKEDIKKQAEELIMQNAALLYGEAGNVEDWKKKYLTTSNQLQQAFACLPDKLRANRSLAHDAVADSWCALKFCSAELRADRELAKAALQQSWKALEIMDPALRSDKEFAMMATRQNPEALKLLPPELMADREVILEAVKQNWQAWSMASVELRDDEELLQIAMDQNVHALGQPARSTTPQALADSMGPKGSVAKHLPPLVMLPEEGKKEDVRTASIGQVAFISELRAGWYHSRCGLVETGHLA